MPQQTGLADNYVTVMDLLAHANYTFEVEALNGVSDLSRSQRLFAAVTVTTGQAGKSSYFRARRTKRTILLTTERRLNSLHTNASISTSPVGRYWCVTDCVGSFMSEYLGF